MPAEPLPKRQSASPLSWLALVVITAVVTTLFWHAGLPGSLLIGPMLVAIGFGVRGTSMRMPPAAFGMAQTVVGCLAASAVNPQVISSFLANWPVFTASVLAVLVASSVIGWLASLWGPLPGMTSVWGMAPGGASAMVMMADAFGADPRLVAVMQYIRLIVVTMGASVVTALWLGGTAGAAVPVVWFPPIEPVPFLSVIGVAVAGSILGRLLRLPGPYLLGPLVLAVALKLMGLVEFQLPQWLLAFSFVSLGWNVGLNFRTETIVLAWRAMPQILLSLLALLVFCGLIGWLMHEMLGIGMLTAYLATAPGGLDAVVIIAAGVREVDLAFVITLQTMRLLFVMLIGPPLARAVSRRIHRG